jgi:hypothetical protein
LRFPIIARRLASADYIRRQDGFFQAPAGLAFYAVRPLARQ